MRIKTIHIENFRGITDQIFNFDEKSSVLFGINGSGKTTVLQAVNLVFSNVVNRLVQNRFKQKNSIESRDVKVGSSTCEIVVDFTYDQTNFTYGRRFDKKSNKRILVHASDLNDFAESFSKLNPGAYANADNQVVNLPIYVNYGVNRSVVDVPLRIRKAHIFDPLYAYENAVQSKVDFRTFFEWFRNREDYENEIRVNQDINFSDQQLKSVRKAVETLLGWEDYSNLCVKRNPLGMKISKNGIAFDIRQLSDGEKCALALVGDLARRAAMANPYSANPLETTGIVLIDEVELHLHPTWQRRIVPTLHDIFPQIQFLISTHSPQVLGEIPDDMKVFALSNSNATLNVREMKSLRWWDINSILENNMQTSAQNLNIRGRINRAYDLVNDEKYSEAEEIVDELEAKTSSKHQDVVRLRFLINRGRR